MNLALTVATPAAFRTRSDQAAQRKRLKDRSVIAETNQGPPLIYHGEEGTPDTSHRSRSRSPHRGMGLETPSWPCSQPSGPVSPHTQAGLGWQAGMGPVRAVPLVERPSGTENATSLPRTFV